MNLFAFVERTPVELAVFALLSAFALLFFAPIGMFLLGKEKAHLSRKPLTATVIGISLLAAVVSILLAGATLLAKPFIEFTLIFSVLFAIRLVRVAKAGWQEIIANYWGGWSTSIFRFLLVFSFLMSGWLLAQIGSDEVATGGIRFNGHENYFSAIPLEIYSADYWGRIKVFDNYPFVWAKFHFFNGGLTSIPLYFFPEKNLVTFQLSKIIIISLMIGVILENIPPISKSRYAAGVVIALFATQVFSHQLWWTFSTNNYSSIFYCFSLFMALFNNNKKIALFYLATFSISTARSVIPAFFMLCAYLVASGVVTGYAQASVEGWGKFAARVVREMWSWLRGFDYLSLSYLGIHLVALLTMLIAGVKTELAFREWGLVRSFLGDAWFMLMSPSLSQPMISVEGNAFNPSPALFGLWGLLVIWMVWATSNIDINLMIRSKVLWASRLPLLGKTLMAILILLLSYLSFKRLDIVATYFAVAVLWYISFPKNASALATKVATAFAASSAVQLIAFSGQLSAPNFVILEWLTLFFVVRLLALIRLEDLGRAHYASIGIIVIASISFFSQAATPLTLTGLYTHDKRDGNTILLPYSEGDKTAGFYKSKQPICELDAPEIAALASVGGARSFFSATKTFNTSVSVAFIEPDERVVSEVVEICTRVEK